MRYAESTTLFNLHNIDYKALSNKIRNSKKNITINLTRLEPFLKLIQDEYRIVNKTDIPVLFEFTISGGHYPTVMMKFEHVDDHIQNVNMLPHVSNNGRDLSFDMSLLDFNKYNLTPEDMFLRLCHRYAGKISDDICCSLYSHHLLKILKKMDLLLNCKDTIYSAVYEKGIYVETNKIFCDCFDIRISTKEMNIESKAKHKSGYFQSFFSINVDTGTGIILDDIKIKFEIYNQVIKLTYEEFMMADVKDIEMAIISLVRLKKVNINDMDNLKAELILQEMISI